MNKEITIATRLENEDNLKISKLIETYNKSGSIIYVKCKANDVVLMTFRIRLGGLKSFKRDLSLLNFVGIKGEIVA